MRMAKVPPGLYAAFSRDGRYWTPMGDHPLIAPGSGNDFDAGLVGHADIANTGKQLEVWYTGYCREPDGSYGLKLRIGFAEIRGGTQ